MKIHKKQQSHRVPARRRYKIEKKVREHKRKMRKAAKKESQKNRFKVTSAPRITVPNEAPFKEQVLQEAEKAREERKLELEAEKREARERLKARATEQDEEDEGDLSIKPDIFEGRKVYPRRTFQSTDVESSIADFTQVIEQSDVVIQVLDARNPFESYCSQVEELVSAAGKKMVLLLNKADLIPKVSLIAWLQYFRKEYSKYPTLAFKSASSWKKVFSRVFNSKKMKKKRRKLRKKKMTSRNWFLLRRKYTFKTSGCIGVDTLMAVFENYRAKKGAQTSMVIGIVGFHQVGKSSVLSSIAGFQNNEKENKSIKKEEEESEESDDEEEETKGEVEMDSDDETAKNKIGSLLVTEHIRLLECRGLIPSHDPLRSCSTLPVSEDEYQPIIGAILELLPVDELLLRYSVGDFTDVEDFLRQLAIKKCMLQKKGAPNLNKAAKMFFDDFQTGKIRYYSETPKAGEDPDELPGLPEEFHLEGLAELEGRDFMEMKAPGILSCMKLRNEHSEENGRSEDEVTPMVIS